MAEPAQTQSEEVVAEWLYLSDRAQQIYGGLVGLSDFGHWDSYFARTFDIYTRLWRFQQQHRNILENKELYGLQRWEIGDIASRIAQLYYHYYLRTSDVSYLQEAFLFYDAVRIRNYYRPGPDRIKSASVGLLVKQLRFYARFIVTCLLLDRRSIVDTLVEELSNLINEYSTAVRGAGETQEWHLVLQEITLFLQSDIPIGYKLTSGDFKAPHRRTLFSTRSLPSSRTDLPIATNPLRLQSCILVGCHQHQVKFSELTLDMYRMMYSLEREPSDLASQSPSIGILGGGNAGAHGGNAASGPSTTPRKNKPNGSGLNPKKFLLYRPTVSQVLLYLASAQRELHDVGVLMLYISADGEAAKHHGSGGFSSSTLSPPASSGVPPTSPTSVSTSSSSIPQASMLHSGATPMNDSTSSLPGLLASTSIPVPEPYATGGVRLKREENVASVAKASTFVSPSGFYPADIIPFTRRPIFLIVDSDNSHSFLSIGTSFGAPLLVLASPQESPIDVLETSQAGGLLTYYLHDPLAAFLFTSNKALSNPAMFQQANEKVISITNAIEDILLTSTDLPVVISQFIADPFMRMFLVRFCFAHYALRLRWAKEVTPDCLPNSSPALPPLVLGSASVTTEFKELAQILGVSSLYP